MQGFSLSSLFALVFGASAIYVTDKAIVDAGGVANTPGIDVGTDGGKPLFARIQLSTDRTFGAAAATNLAGTIAAAAAEGAAIHEAAAAAQTGSNDPHA